MGMPADVGIVDTMIGFPHSDMKEAYRFVTRQTKDAESREKFTFPVEYIFKDVPAPSGRVRRSDRGHPRRDGPVGHRAGDRRRRTSRVGSRGPPAAPGPVHPLAPGPTPTTARPGSGASSASTRPSACGRSLSSRPGPSPRSPSTTRRCTRSTPSASSSPSRSSAAPACPAHA